MDYFEISFNTDLKIVDCFEQIQELTISVIKEIIDMFGELELSRRDFRPQLPNLYSFKLNDNAFLT